MIKYKLSDTAVNKKFSVETIGAIKEILKLNGLSDDNKTFKKTTLANIYWIFI